MVPGGGAWSRGGVPGPWGGSGPGGLVSQHALRQTLPATAADSTHPTGMHPCFNYKFTYR